MDPTITSWVTSHLSPGSTLVDVGAHIGTISLRGAKVVGPTGSVLAIEPHPVTASRLRDNIAASGVSNIRVEQVACGDTAGKVTFYEGPTINQGASSLSKENVLSHSGDGRVQFEVDLVPLDQIVDSLGLSRVDVIKIDTEGAELKVLRGAENTLRKFRPVLILETVDSHLRGMGDSLDDLEAHLRDRGYRKARNIATDTEWIPETPSNTEPNTP